jgi:hypothetical protein
LVQHDMQGGASAEDAEGSGDLESVGQGRRPAANVPVGAPVGAMLVIAHVENLLEIEGTLTVPAEDNDLTRYAAGRWVAAGEAAMAAHPYAPAAHQLFGWLLRNDTDRLRFHLSRSRERIAFLPWPYLQGGDDAYRELLTWARVKF